MEPLSNDEMGDLGEDVVRKWARRAGIECSTPDKDRKGWDLFLEFRLRDDEVSDVDKPLDKDSREVKALAQVKTTSRTPGQWRIKLSNLVSLVEHGGPSYIVVLEMDSKYPDAEVETAYVVHVGRDLIAEVLEKQRELEYERLQAKAEGEDPESVQLHKHKLPVLYEDSPLPVPSYRSFREALVAPLRGDPQRYLDWKREVYEGVGYDEETGMAIAKGKFSIRLPEEYQDSPEDYFVDTAFDRVDSMKVEGGEIHDIRFGIPSEPEPLPESQLFVDVQSRKVKARLRRPGLGNRITVRGEEQFVELPAEDGSPYRAVRLLLAHAELIYRTGKGPMEIKFGFDLDTGRYPLEDLWKTADLAVFMREAGENKQDVEVQVRGQSSDQWARLPKLEISESVSFEDLHNEEVRLFISATRHARRLADDLDIRAQLDVSIEQLHTYRTVMHTYSELCRVQDGQSTNEGLFMGFDRVSEIPEELLEGKSEVCFVDLMSLQLGDHLIVISFGLSGQLSSLEVSKEDTPGEVERKRSATAQLANGVDGYELSIEEVFYLQPYCFEQGEDTPGREVFLKDPFEGAVGRCQCILSLTEAGDLAMYVV